MLYLLGCWGITSNHLLGTHIPNGGLLLGISSIVLPALPEILSYPLTLLSGLFFEKACN